MYVGTMFTILRKPIGGHSKNKNEDAALKTPNVQDTPISPRQRRRLSKPQLSSKSTFSLLSAQSQPGRDPNASSSTINTATWSTLSSQPANEQPRELVKSRVFSFDSETTPYEKPLQERASWNGAAFVVNNIETHHATPPSPLSPTKRARRPLSAILNAARTSGAESKLSFRNESQSVLIESAEEEEEARLRSFVSDASPEHSITRSDGETKIRRKSLRTPGIATRIDKENRNPRADLSPEQQQYYYNQGLSDESPLGKLVGLEVSNDDEEWTPPPRIPRAETPSDLESGSLGGLQLGSLRITNGCPSPAPSALSTLIDKRLKSGTRDASSEYGDHDEENQSDQTTARHKSPPTLGPRPRIISPLRDSSYTLNDIDDADSTMSNVVPDRISLDATPRPPLLPAHHHIRTLSSDIRATEYMAELPTSPFVKTAIDYTSELAASPFEDAPPSPSGTVVIKEVESDAFEEDFQSEVTADCGSNQSSFTYLEPNSALESPFVSGVELPLPSSLVEGLKAPESKLFDGDSGYNSSESLQSSASELKEHTQGTNDIEESVREQRTHDRIDHPSAAKTPQMSAVQALISKFSPAPKTVARKPVPEMPARYQCPAAPILQDDTEMTYEDACRVLEPPRGRLISREIKRKPLAHQEQSSDFVEDQTMSPLQRPVAVRAKTLATSFVEESFLPQLRRPGPRPMIASILKPSRSKTADLPTFSNLHHSTATVPTIEVIASPTKRKPKKLQKMRPLSQPPPVRYLGAAGNHDLTQVVLPNVPVEFTANLNIRTAEVPELERTYQSMHETKSTDPVQEHIPTSPAEIKFPSPKSSLYDFDDDAKPSKPSRPSFQGSNKRWSFFERRSTSQQRPQSSATKAEVYAMVHDFGTVTTALGRSPYDMALRQPSSSQAPSEPSAQSRTAPGNITTAKARPKSTAGMDAETAAEMARLRSKNIQEMARDRRRQEQDTEKDAWKKKRESFDHQEGMPAKQSRPVIWTAEAPPMPFSNLRPELRQRQSWEAEHDVPSMESSRILTRNERIPYHEQQGPDATLGPPIDLSIYVGSPMSYESNRFLKPMTADEVLPPVPPSHSPRPMSLHNDHDDGAPPPPKHSPRPMQVDSAAQITTDLPSQDVWAAQANYWRQRRQSVAEHPQQQQTSMSDEVDRLFPQLQSSYTEDELRQRHQDATGPQQRASQSQLSGSDRSRPPISPEDEYNQYGMRGRSPYYGQQHAPPRSSSDQRGRSPYYAPEGQSRYSQHVSRGPSPYGERDELDQQQHRNSRGPSPYRVETEELVREGRRSWGPSPHDHLSKEARSRSRGPSPYAPTSRPPGPPPSSTQHHHNQQPYRPRSRSPYAHDDDFSTPFPPPSSQHQQHSSSSSVKHTSMRPSFESSRPLPQPRGPPADHFTHSTHAGQPPRSQPQSPYPSRPHSRISNAHSFASSMAEDLNPNKDERPSIAPDFGRYSGGMSFGYEKSQNGKGKGPGGFQGSTGTRSVSGKNEASRKGTQLMGEFGIDLGDVPVMARLQRIA